jgi:hypothetical protein
VRPLVFSFPVCRFFRTAFGRIAPPGGGQLREIAGGESACQMGVYLSEQELISLAVPLLIASRCGVSECRSSAGATTSVRCAPSHDTRTVDS